MRIPQDADARVLRLDNLLIRPRVSTGDEVYRQRLYSDACKISSIGRIPRSRESPLVSSRCADTFNHTLFRRGCNGGGNEGS
jgi:hypothetical protein